MKILNKKGMEGEGVNFSMKQIVMIIIFLAVVAVLIILYFVIGGVGSGSFSETVVGFGTKILRIIGWNK